MRGGVVTLKTYEEIVAMDSVDAKTELNTHPEEYYNKFNNEGHLYLSAFLSSDGTYNGVYKRGNRYIQYGLGGSSTWDTNNEPIGGGGGQVVG